MLRLGTQLKRLRSLLRPRWSRRRRHPSAVLLIALCCVFAEPVACIIHCQIYIPWLLRHQRVHPHAHAVTAGEPTVAAGVSFPGRAQLAPRRAGSASTSCFHAIGRGNSSPGPAVPASPVHDLILATSLLCLSIAGIQRIRAHAPLWCAQAAPAPPTPPPQVALV